MEAVEIPEVRLVIWFLRQKKLDSGMMKGSTPGQNGEKPKWVQ